jgi:uncharacterized membrane protein (DUF485 family)
MFSKTNLIATIVGAIWAYIAGWLLWSYLGASLFSSPNTNTGDQVHVIIACVISTFVVSTIYSKWAGGDYSLSKGATYGLWYGILIGFGERWYDYAFQMYTSTLNDAIINGILNIVFGVVLGVLISLVYGKVK